MKKKTKIIILTIVIALVILAVLGVVFLQKDWLKNARNQAANYQNYHPTEAELAKLSISQRGDIYYYATDGKRYVFPNQDVFASWFGIYPLAKIKKEDLTTLYKTPLGGTVFFRPGTLMGSETLQDTFIVIKNGSIIPFGDTKLLEKVYGKDWKKTVYLLPDYYFSEYKIGKPLNAIENWPDIPASITIDQDKNLSK